MNTMKNTLRGLGVASLLAICNSVHAQDARSGQQVFAQCEACHSVDGTNGVGPSLKGIVGRKSGSLPGFRYSSAMKGAGLVWNDKTLNDYVADPQKAVPGNVMPYSGIADAKQRKDLIAYLKTVR